MADKRREPSPAVWNPPRLRVLGLGVDTGSGGRGDPTTETWEGSCPAPGGGISTPRYRSELGRNSTLEKKKPAAASKKLGLSPRRAFELGCQSLRARLVSIGNRAASVP